jgi:hypothetical protein
VGNELNVHHMIIYACEGAIDPNVTMHDHRTSINPNTLFLAGEED